MPPDHNGVATFRIGKRRWARWPLSAGSRAPSQASRSSLLTLTPVRTHTATHVPFCLTTLRPRLHSCSTRHQLFLVEISTVAVYFPCAFTTCLRPRGYPRRPGRMEMGLWCLPSLISPPFRVRHLTYATSCRTSGLQTVPRGLANTPVCRPAICANTRALGPTLHANGPTLMCKRLANRPVGQHAMRIGLPHARPWCRGNPSREAGDSRACKARRWSLILAGFGRLALCHA